LCNLPDLRSTPARRSAITMKDTEITIVCHQGLWSRGRRSQTVGADCLTLCHPRDRDPRSIAARRSAITMKDTEITIVCDQREVFIGNLLVRIHFIIVMIRWTGLAPWEFEFIFQVALHLPSCERFVLHCRTTGASTAPCTSRRMCCPTHCASYCAPCQPHLRAFPGWI